MNPWLSLGGFFDYALWDARDRFIELDKAIASAPVVPDYRGTSGSRSSYWETHERDETPCLPMNSEDLARWIAELSKS